MHLSINLIKSHGAWGVFWPAEHIFYNYFGAQKVISSQIFACSTHFMVPEGFFPDEHVLTTISVYDLTLIPRRRFPRET